MVSHVTEISRNGKVIVVPAIDVDGVTVVSTGRFPRIASIHDEAFVDVGVPRDPERFIGQVAASRLPADVVTFTQNLHDSAPQYSYFFEWDNVAAAETTDFARWWELLPQATRKNCRRAAREGVVTRPSCLDAEFGKGIKRLYDEAPIRQGRKFWHYGKDLDTILRENSSFLDRSEFVGAYLNEELIGFIKIVYVGPTARIMQILASASHYDKRPMNALIAKAVELCSERGATHLIYSKFQYGNKANDPLIEFKRRNGFERLQFPRYYVPLTIGGRLAIAARLHRGPLGLLPPVVLNAALQLRESANRFRSARLTTVSTAQTANADN